MADDAGRLIRNLVLETVERSQDEREQAPVQRLSATGHCLRQQYYKLTGVQGTRLRPQSLWEMRDGDLHESDIKEWLQKAGYTLSRHHNDRDSEVVLTLPDGTVVPGHIDGVIEGPTLYQPHLLEIKSMSFIRYATLVLATKRLRDEEKVEFPGAEALKETHRDYYLQMQIYMLAGRQAGEPWGDCGFLVAKAKDSSAAKMRLRGMSEDDYKVFMERVPFDAEEAERGVQRHIMVAEGVRDGLMLAREYTLGKDWNCNPLYCQFSKICWGTN